MKANRIFTLVAILAVLLMIVSCTPSAAQIQAAMTQTQEAIPPTYTPYPTYTPFPTPTLVPTPTPVPSIDGIDTPVTVSGVTLKFYSASVSTVAVELGSETLTPNAGYSVLLLSADYTGNQLDLFDTNGLYQPDKMFYVTDSSGNAFDWVHMIYTSSSITVGFFVRSDTGPYFINNAVGTSWSIDLTPILH